MKLTLNTRSKTQIQAITSYRLAQDKKAMNHAIEVYLLVSKSLAAIY